MSERRIALISDIHGNLAALDAVLRDIAALGPSEPYCLGDLVGYGPDPVGVVGRMRDLGIPTVRGNYDDGVGNRLGRCGCFYTTEKAKADGDASYAFTDAALGDADHAWLAALPDDLRLEKEGLQIVLTHGSPRKINEYLMPDRPEAQLLRMAGAVGADVVCVGHVHIAYHRAMTAEDGARVHYVSAGSVGKPQGGDPRACWVELFLASADEVRAGAPADEAAGPVGHSEAWLGAVAHRVSYDVEAVAAATVAAGLPTAFAERLRTG